MEDINIDINVGKQGLDSLQQLKQDIKDATAEVIKLRSAEIIDEDAIISATKRAGDLRDQFSAANDAIKTMTAGDEFEKMGNNVGLLSSQVNNLDFGGAAESAKQFTSTLKGINPAKMKDDFLSFAGSVAGLSKQFVKMGISLLANPIFLIVAVVAAIVIAIVLLKDKLVVLEKAFDILMIPVRAIIQGLKDLTDWMGLTSYASDEMADTLIKNNERVLESNKKSNDKLAGEYNRKLALMKANGEDTSAIELAEAKRVTENSEKNVKLLAKDIDTLIAKQKDKTRAEKEEIQKQVDEKRKQYEQETQIYLNSANNIQVLIDTTATKQREEDKKNNEKAGAERDKAIAASKAARAKADAEALEALKRRYDVERQITQASILEMEDGIQKELAINEEKQRIQLEDLQFTKYTESEKNKIRETYQVQREVADKKAFADASKRREDQRVKDVEIEKKYQDELKAIQQSYEDFIIAKTGTDGEIRTKAINDERNKQLAQLQKAFEAEKASKKLNDLELEVLEREHQARMNMIIGIADANQKQSDELTKQERIDAKIGEYMEVAEIVSGFIGQISDIINAGIENRIQASEEERDRVIGNLDKQQSEELSVVGLTESQKTAINDKYAKKKYQAELKAFNETERLKKKQFDNDKAFRMVGVVMDTARGITSAIGQFGLPAAVPLIAATAAIGATQLAVIASQKYKGASGPSAPSSGGSGAGNASEPMQPNLTLNGDNNKENERSSVANVTDKNQPTFIVKAVVSETEITSTQERVARIKASGEL